MAADSYRWAHLCSVRNEYRDDAGKTKQKKKTNPPSPSLYRFHLTFSTRQETLKPFSRHRRLSPPAVSTDLARPEHHSYR